MLEEGINIVGILKSSRTSGRESIVINVPSFHPNFFEENEMKKPVASICMGIVLMKHFQSVDWLSKDIIFLVSDANFQSEGVKVWLDNYHNYFQAIPVLYPFYDHPALTYMPHQNITQSYSIPVYHQPDFIRSGVIRGGLVLDFYAEEFYFILLSLEGINGKLPNLDLTNSIDRVAMYSENVHTILFDENNRVMDYLFTGDDALFPNFPFTVMQLVTFALNCAIGEPAGNHGWFLQYVYFNSRKYFVFF